MKVCQQRLPTSLSRQTLLSLDRQLSHGLFALALRLLLLSRGKPKFSRSSLDPSPSHHLNFCSACKLEFAVAVAVAVAVSVAVVGRR
jgi:hypothetical protein